MKLELQHIHKSFGPVHANEDVCLSVEAGTIHGLLGENGAGKSTLVKVLSGFVVRDQGTIVLGGQPVVIRTPADALRAGVGMLHQDPLDFPPLTVLDNFQVGQPGRFWRNRRAAVRQFRQLAAQLNFNLDVNEWVGNLTVGERQQLELLRLLSLGSRSLILDEPTTGISASQKTALFAALKALAAQGMSIIFVSHKLEDVEDLCNRVTVLRQGRVVGNLELPCPTQHLVELMFGRQLALPVKPPTHQEAILLRLDHIVLSDQRLRVRIDQLSVRCGEVIGLVGLEGSGQRLLLLLCAGLLRSNEGSLTLNATHLTRKPYRDYRRAGIGYLPADRLREGLISGLTIQEHVVLRSCRAWWIRWSEALNAAQQLIRQFNIRGQPNTRVERLSGGNQQRTQLALLPTPLNLLLMEHPTRGLDIESALWVWEQLIARCQTGTAILFASSDLDEIMQYSDRVIVFSGGQVSAPIDAARLTTERLGEMIGGKFALPVPTAPLP